MDVDLIIKMFLPEKNESTTQGESHVGVKHSGVALQERDQGCGEGGQLRHLSHTRLSIFPASVLYINAGMSPGPGT